MAFGAVARARGIGGIPVPLQQFIGLGPAQAGDFPPVGVAQGVAEIAVPDPD
ncbi:hypothetical protein ACWICO_06395 [Glutamicibacter sp. NPDC055491]